MFKTCMHLNAYEFFQSQCSDMFLARIRAWDLSKELAICDDSGHAAIVWSDKDNYYDCDDNGPVAEIGRWIAKYLPGIDYIYVDFKVED